MLTAKYDGLLPEPPYSEGMARFLLSLDNLSEYVGQHALRALRSFPPTLISS